jgi:hypothetical protein
MKEFNAEEVRFETASALETVRRAQAFIRHPAYIGLDVHKETIVVAVARASRDAPESRGEIANKPKAVAFSANRSLGGLPDNSKRSRSDAIAYRSQLCPKVHAADSRLLTTMDKRNGMHCRA